jgi:hypothetical protein
MFQSWSSFLSFKEKVEHEERYFYNKDIQEFLDEVMITGSERIESVPMGQRYWRAQLGSDEVPCYDFNGTLVDYNPVPYTVKRMKPLPDKVPEGRVNPKGIPYLYLATDEKTAVSEMRQWVGKYITLAEFETCRDLKFVDCSRCDIDPMNTTVHDLDMLWKLKPPEAQETTLTVWRWIDMAFSKPIDRCDSSADYVSTQIIAELFKKNGFDGVKYRSLFNGGKNIALFDIDSAKQRENSAKVIQITKMDLEFKQVHPLLMKKELNRK